eukprot:gnl/Dysnectes_brevis/416_a459_5836.p1 GENE.gnl/Dysnectes_brevis/416_a459_5836~~gnl/Dysnectes_brevis/416_a459_5836.p1  ORF type:complete len:1209 (+),score=382.39 gnl/Dysnectes_brevis/416_a459_5836:215-3841(+)
MSDIIKQTMKTMDGNAAAAHIAHKLSEICTLFPITPASPMGEYVDTWTAEGRKNVWGNIPDVHQMQSEGGVAGALHGAAMTGAITSTYTSSQGLLLMIPNMYKMAGELLPAVMHVASRVLGTHAQAIYGDHSDVMAIRSTGWPMIVSSNVQECMDISLATYMAAYKTSLPFVQFFDGFRTSHELSKISVIPDEVIKGMMDPTDIKRFRERAANPEHPVVRGTVAGHDTFYQFTQALAPHYIGVPDQVQECLDKLGEATGRHYKIFEFTGAEDAEDVVVCMGSGTGVVHEAVEYLNSTGKKVAAVDVRLFRPFSPAHLRAVLPKTVKRITVLDRSYEQASAAPLYLDVMDAVNSPDAPDYLKTTDVYTGTFGIGGKEFTPSHAVSVFENMAQTTPKNNFTVNINDDVLHSNLPLPEKNLDTVPEGTVQCMFYGLGADGTVGANKEAISLIADFPELWDKHTAAHPDQIELTRPNYVPGTPAGSTDDSLFCQGFFAYDAKKSGGVTVSHLRFGKQPIHSQYMIDNADFIACHNPSYLEKYDMLSPIKENGIFLMNSSNLTPEEWSATVPASVRRELAEKNVRLFNVDAFDIAGRIGLGQRINMIMQTAFFALSNVLPLDQILKLLKGSIQKKYGKKGQKVVDMNCAAVEEALNHIVEIKYDREAWLQLESEPKEVDMSRPEFVRSFMDRVAAREGYDIPVSDMLVGTGLPSGTSKYEKRGIAVSVPIWDSKKCIQCNKCAFACPHSAIRAFIMSPEEAKAAKALGLKAPKARGKELKGFNFGIQVSPLDCVGCGVCANACPADALTMTSLADVRATEGAKWDFLETVPNRGHLVDKFTVKGVSFQEPLLEYPGSCPGCGESPYIKLLTQLFGERLEIANASGCTVVWAGSTGFAPYTMNSKGRGPAWSNSLFEDNAEFGYGFQAAAKARRKALKAEVMRSIDGVAASPIKDALNDWIREFDNGDASRQIADRIQALLPEKVSPESPLFYLWDNQDMLAKPTVWCVGGDGWAYDIGFGGLDHVLASGEDVNIIVLDTEVYSNTGGQASKATPAAAVAKFAAGGRAKAAKDLGKMMMSYGNVYVASISMGADPAQTIRAMREAESYDGPSLILAYSPCINHGLKAGMGESQIEEKIVVETGLWPIYRFDPRLEHPLQLDQVEATRPLTDLLEREVRFTSLMMSNPEEATKQRATLQKDITDKLATLHAMAEL